MGTNERKINKPDSEEYYNGFSKTLANASAFLTKALDEESFIFMEPKKAVLDHFKSHFDIYDPLNPTSSDEVGLRLYHVCDRTVLAFGNENVKLCDGVMDVLEGKYGLPNLIHHHQKKRDLLERLKTQTALSLDEETRKLEYSLFAKPEQLCGWDGEAPKQAFADILVRSLQNKFNLDEDKAKLHLENKRKGRATNPLIDQFLEKEITEHIDLKIGKRAEKIEILEGIVDSFKDVLLLPRPQRVARFREEFPYLGDMFE